MPDAFRTNAPLVSAYKLVTVSDIAVVVPCLGDLFKFEMYVFLFLKGL